MLFLQISFNKPMCKYAYDLIMCRYNLYKVVIIATFHLAWCCPSYLSTSGKAYTPAILFCYAYFQLCDK